MLPRRLAIMLTGVLLHNQSKPRLDNLTLMDFNCQVIENGRNNTSLFQGIPMQMAAKALSGHWAFRPRNVIPLP